jgi:hypothetical protein
MYVEKVLQIEKIIINVVNLIISILVIINLVLEYEFNRIKAIPLEVIIKNYLNHFLLSKENVYYVVLGM